MQGKDVEGRAREERVVDSAETEDTTARGDGDTPDVARGYRQLCEKGGFKEKAGKLRFELVPLEALEGIIRVLEYGANKYKDDNWKIVPNAINEYRGALLRHMAKMQAGEEYDKESGLRHVDHIATNAMFLCWLYRHTEELK